jgi:hypothetical protein
MAARLTTSASRHSTVSALFDKDIAPDPTAAVAMRHEADQA